MARVFVAGHGGMVGSALVRALAGAADTEIITSPHASLDLTRQAQVERFFDEQAIDQVYLAAARVGGIQANDWHPAGFIYENLMIEANVIHAAYQTGVRRLLMLGSSCVYPREAPQPIPENALMSGPLEATNEAYAVAKIAGIKLCEAYNRERGTDFRSVMPTNLYGPNDNFDLDTGHVLPALLRKFHQAVLDGTAEVEVWGSGRPRREFLHVDDLASACLFVMALSREQYLSATEPRNSHLNVGWGRDISVAEMAELIARITGFEGEIHYNPDFPDGTPRKLLDTSRMDGLGWSASIPLEQGMADTLRWMKEHWNEVVG